MAAREHKPYLKTKGSLASSSFLQSNSYPVLGQSKEPKTSRGADADYVPDCKLYKQYEKS